ncbi:MAG: gluconeogenesis factor YvcK family protein [Minisyncoccia bacterium]
MKKEKKKNVVVIGGGTGVFVVLNSLKNSPFHLSAIISMADSGGSTGILREEFGILPPGDVRRALIALSHSDNKILAKLFNYRFNESYFLDGHSFGNLFLTALERITGSFQKAILEAGKILNISGEVIPVTLQNCHLVAQLKNGQIIYGEAAIDRRKEKNPPPIKKIWLQPPVKINPLAKEAILKADVIIIGPGDLYTSILPNFLVKGVKDTIKKSKAKKIFITNIMTKKGETDNFTTADFIRVFEKYVGKNILNYVVINTRQPDKKRIKKYQEEGSKFVRIVLDKKQMSKYQIIKEDLLRKKGLLRHDPIKLKNILEKIIYSQ